MSTHGHIFTSDLHLGKGDPADDFSQCASHAYIRMMRKKPNATYWNLGDLFDTEDDLADILRVHMNVINYMYLKPRLSLVRGNHDGNLSWMRAFGFTVYGTQVKQMLNGEPTLLTHGHLWDKYNKPGTSVGKHITRLVSFLERHVHEDTDDALRKLRAYVDGNLAHYETAIAALAKRLGCTQAIYGHTHTPYIKIVDGVIIANCGTWTHNFNGKGYPAIVSENRLKLKYVQPDGSMKEWE